MVKQLNFAIGTFFVFFSCSLWVYYKYKDNSNCKKSITITEEELNEIENSIVEIKKELEDIKSTI